MGLISWMFGIDTKGRKYHGEDGINSDKYKVVKGLDFKGKSLDKLPKRDKQLIAYGAVMEAENAKDRRLHGMAKSGTVLKYGKNAGKTAQDVLNERTWARAESKVDAQNKKNKASK